MSFTLGQLARDCGGELSGDAALEVNGVSTDTRALERGQLFVAIRGERFDGHDYASDALARGAAAVLVSRARDVGSGPSIAVEDTVAALGRLAACHRSRFARPVVAVTGSNGKTTTKEMCARILSARGLSVCRSRGSLNNHIGLPLSVLALGLDQDALVVELGMNHPGEIDSLAEIASPTVGAVTNVRPAHLGPMGSIEAIARAKGELFDRIRPEGTAVVNADDPHCVAQSKRFGGKTLRFGRSEPAEFRASGVHTTPSGESFELETESGRCRIELRAVGAHLVEDALCAAAAATATGLLGSEPLGPIRDGLAAFAPVPGRLALRDAPGGVRVLDDTYNANPDSVAAALATLATRAGSGRSVAVLGDMLELGPDARALHAEAGRAAAANGIDVVIAVGPLSEHVADAAARAGVADASAVPDPAEAPERVRVRVREGDTVLVKGSRGMRMERVVAALLERA